jgi:mono/diheme cytochrome c family protein
MPPLPHDPLTPDQKNAIYKWIMQGAKNNSCQESCDSTTFSYSAAIKLLISNFCVGCHSTTGASGGVDLSTYSGVKTKVSDGRLWGAINQLPGYVAMPQNGQRLTDCQLTQFKKWIAAGAPNN